MTEENKIIPFPKKGELPVEIDGLVVKALFFDGNRLWVDVYHRTPAGDLININTEPVDLGPGSTITINLAARPSDA